ncbi:MAG TPA: hypothetical protein VK669_08445 [Candidatus Limnocylindrales bacterium]|nr:hypothetical protein [Candidatus Limnocylindrales bacterium]
MYLQVAPSKKHKPPKKRQKLEPPEVTTTLSTVSPKPEAEAPQVLALGKTRPQTRSQTAQLKTKTLSKPVEKASSPSSHELSDYEESDYENSDDEFEKFNSKSAPVREAYRKRAKGKGFKINTSEGLKALVEAAETGHPAANTHLLYRTPTTRYSALQLNSAYGTRVALGRYRLKGDKGGPRIDVSGQSVRLQQTTYKNVHGEMQLLFNLTGGVASKIPNVLNGYTVVVDKPTCADCIGFVRQAAPAELRDSTTSIDSNVGRETYDNWTNPFDGEKRNVSLKRKR